MNLRRLPFLFAVAFIASCLFANPSRAAQDCTSITDPAGDVTIERPTTTMDVADTDGSDIIAAGAVSSTDGWTFDVTTTAAFVVPDGQLANIDLVIDHDGDPSNNFDDSANERAGSDSFFVLISTTSSTAPWKIKHQVFDVTTHMWKTQASGIRFTMKENHIRVLIPHKALPVTPDMRWRIVTNVGKIGSWHTRDSAPERSSDPSACGYSPFVPATLSAGSETSGTGPSWLPYALAGFGLAVMGIAMAKGRG